MENINTKSYWDNRFASGDWETKLGRSQTKEFAKSQIKHLEIVSNFSGTILDFGCGLGDAFPIYKKAYPNAKLIGLDISQEAIKKCAKTYGHLGTFICGNFKDVPKVDIIIASNVFEHLTDDKTIVQILIKKCQQLNIFVPYKERLIPNNEHINSYAEDYFLLISEYHYKVFTSKGWGNNGIKLFYNIYLKNILRPFLGKPIVSRPKQIMFRFKN